MIFILSKDSIEFPDPELAKREEPFKGLLAIGGDLSCERLIEAYKNGIFPWYSEENNILWWSPDPRFVLFPEKLHVSRRLERKIRQKVFEVKFNTAFDKVIKECARSIPKRPMTWIQKEMIPAYIELYNRGYGFSAESWRNGKLVGGLYGVMITNRKNEKIFCGESMFYRETDASKVAFVTMVRHLIKDGLKLIDCQMKTDYLASFGAEEIPRSDFLRYLRDGF